MIFRKLTDQKHSMDHQDKAILQSVVIFHITTSPGGGTAKLFQVADARHRVRNAVTAFRPVPAEVFSALPMLPCTHCLSERITSTLVTVFIAATAFGYAGPKACMDSLPDYFKLVITNLAISQHRRFQTTVRPKYVLCFCGRVLSAYCCIFNVGAL